MGSASDGFPGCCSNTLTLGEGRGRQGVQSWTSRHRRGRRQHHLAAAGSQAYAGLSRQSRWRDTVEYRECVCPLNALARDPARLVPTTQQQRAITELGRYFDGSAESFDIRPQRGDARSLEFTRFKR